MAGDSRREESTYGHPSYAACFKCIGPACEDICCVDWDIPVDRKTYERYTFFPVERLGKEVAEFVAVEPGPQPDELFASIHRSRSGACPFLDTDRLCRIQKNYGQALLPSSCSIYPRSLAFIDNRLEGSLSLSCPEAARNVLLDPEFVDRRGDLHSGNFRTDNVFTLVKREFVNHEAEFINLRRELITAVRNRTRSLRERLLCIGRFCLELDAASSISDVNAALERLSQQVVKGIEDFYAPGDTQLKLRTAFDLSEARLGEGCGSRFEETFLWFAQGVGSGPGSTQSGQIAGFESAQREFFVPYFERCPWVLENYVINYIFQNLFPFGRKGSADFVTRNAWGEYSQMAIQIAWLQGLLVGAAGFFKESFAGEHVVHVVQSMARTIEHYPEVLASLSAYLRSRKLDSLNGIAALL